ncbi:hypothetical protein JHK85_006511 [Glycine max]|nr:hypothetical protein JHK85_006511 [Glycine max]
MKKLRLLQLAGVQLVGDFKYLSKDIGWLCWHGFPLACIPTNLYQGSLVSIELENNNVNLLWKEAQAVVLHCTKDCDRYASSTCVVLSKAIVLPFVLGLFLEPLVKLRSFFGFWCKDWRIGGHLRYIYNDRTPFEKLADKFFCPGDHF